MSSELLMDAKLRFPSEEAIAQFLQFSNARNVSICDYSVEGIFSENVINTACSVFKAALTVMPYYLSNTTFSTYSGDNAMTVAE